MNTLVHSNAADRDTEDIFFDDDFVRLLQLPKSELADRVEYYGVDRTRISYIDAVLLVLSETNDIAARLLAKTPSGDDAIRTIFSSSNLQEKSKYIILNQLRSMLKFDLIRKLS